MKAKENINPSLSLKGYYKHVVLTNYFVKVLHLLCLKSLGIRLLHAENINHLRHWRGKKKKGVVGEAGEIVGSKLRQWSWSALGLVCVPRHTADSVAEEWHFLTPLTLLNELRELLLELRSSLCCCGPTHITMLAAGDFQKLGGYRVSTWACHQKNEPKWTPWATSLDL